MNSTFYLNFKQKIFYAKFNYNVTFIDKVEEISKLMISLRYLSIDCIESIVQWRERLHYLSSKSSTLNELNWQDFKFMWDHENYLIKMKSDTMFLK